MANIDTLCPHCDRRLRLEAGKSVPDCPGCRRPFPAQQPPPPPKTAPFHCTVCGGQGFYLQKDFNQNLGCLIFIAGAVLAPFTHYLSLLVGLALDGILYFALPYATLCYTCRSIYRGYARNPQHAAYDPNTAWAHRPREGPWAQPQHLRETARSSGTGSGRGSLR